MVRLVFDRMVKMKEKGSVVPEEDRIGDLETAAAIKIQHYWKNYVFGKSIRHQQSAATKIQSHYHGWLMSRSFASKKRAIITIQRSFRCLKSRRNVEIHREKSAIIIQAHVRGWMARTQAYREKQCLITIQSHWKGYLPRKNARGQRVDLRLRMQKSAANIDDSMRLINRLIAALRELLNMRCVSGILHTCLTLDVATELSQRCCEELVAAGAVGTLLKLIRSVSRSIPDQQVLKHALSTLRNLARYPHVTQVLVDTPGCLETVILEFIRNKEEGYFIASDLLKRICANENGAKAIRKSPALSRRLNNLAEELSRKAGNDKRNARNLVGREHADKRLREVVLLLKLIANA